MRVIRLSTYFRKSKTPSFLVVGVMQEKEEMAFPKALASMKAKMDKLFRLFPCGLVRCYTAEVGRRRIVTTAKAQTGSLSGHPHASTAKEASPFYKTSNSDKSWQEVMSSRRELEGIVQPSTRPYLRISIRQ